MIHLEQTVDIDGKASERIARQAYVNAFFQSGFANPIDRAICDHQKYETDGVQKSDEIPYDFIRKRLSVRVSQDGKKVMITKGALANVLECCTKVEMSSGELVDLGSRRDSIDRRFAEMSNEILKSCSELMLRRRWQDWPGSTSLTYWKSIWP